MNVSDFDYDLPEELIAQHPCDKRDQARLMVLDRRSETITHDNFYNLTKYFHSDHLLVLNNTKVFSARLIGQRETGGKVELLLLREIRENLWEVLMKPAKRLTIGSGIFFKDSGFSGTIEKNLGGGRGYVLFHCKGNFMETVERLGSAPLPHYINRNIEDQDIREVDRTRYQTVYASELGAVAAPTAGLHFTPELIRKLRDNGTEVVEITLHVGPGTFRPLIGERIEDHIMEDESFYLSPEAAHSLNLARLKGKKIVAVGTTTTRALETAIALYPKELKPCSGSTNLFIYPGYNFRLVNKLITNFHMPRSTPLLLASAFAGKSFLYSAYGEAIKKAYRFLSFGDSMLVL
ncbi:MAG: tRNA preQ1(34) S-adenosylmethionine ribosyltransferase-isomerase QueA [Candidatus Tectomicrobia bacterium]|uniref:S-adenosylmethionine:tRNA ribosyltransferase-isomerase n=1 Tax=Tectimicrobiota bacterium TaxID=2528274 RepID=A0A933GMG6_UNCTE|nr:tRNA preQ1(34) S-adenosylmethionine ribosyltransferase-isomerase QueA [Candidatus Tectomicrobia bacterium]